MDEGYYYEDDDDEGMDEEYYEGLFNLEYLQFTFIIIITLFLFWTQCRTLHVVVLFVIYLGLLLYEESVRNLKRAEAFRNKAQALLRRDQRERRYLF